VQGSYSEISTKRPRGALLIEQGEGQMLPLIAQPAEPAYAKTDWIRAYAFTILLSQLQPYRLTVLLQAQKAPTRWIWRRGALRPPSMLAAAAE
jgi:hypothetical protein